jgi:serine protease Do
MTRTKEWTKFGFLLAVTILLAAGFASALNLPRSEAQQPNPVVLQTTSAATLPEAQPAADLGKAFVAVAEAVRPAVVFIESEVERPRTAGRTPFDDFFNSDPETQKGQGSGFIISKDGYILTNNHVVEGATRITVRLLDRHSFEATLVGRDPETDIAVIKIDNADNLKPVTLGKSSDVRIGEWALAIGNPLGEAFSFTVTAGIVSGVGRRLDGLRRGQDYSIHDFIQTDAAINPGNSGGPLVNIRGEVIGVNSAIASPTGLYTGYGFAVPIDLARAVSQQLIAKGEVTRAVLGVMIGDADALDAEYVGLDSVFGVKVQQYSDESSPSKRAGIKEGDIIVAVDGEPALYTAQLQTKIGFRKPGDVVSVTVARKGGERQTYDVRLGAATDLHRTTVARETSNPSHAGAPVMPVIGVAVEEISRSELVDQGLARNAASELTGLRITRVDPHGPARDSRLVENEIITYVNDQRVSTVSEFESALAGIRSGEIFSVRTAFLNPDTGEVRHRTVRIRAGSR